MGIGGSSLNIPGGGTEGYHVLKVIIFKLNWKALKKIKTLSIQLKKNEGSRKFTRLKSGFRSIF